MFEDHTRKIYNKSFLDCGAHSVHTGTLDEIPIEEYAAFLEDHHEKFDIIAAPDVVGDSRQTEINTFKFMKLIEGKVPVEKILPVYHLQCRKISDLERAVTYARELGLSRFALGGALGVGFTHDEKYAALVSCRGKIPREEFKVHLFGIFVPGLIRAFKPDSFDSSVGLQVGRFQKLINYHNGKWGHVSFEQLSAELSADQAKKRFEEYLIKYAEELKDEVPIAGTKQFAKEFWKSGRSAQALILNTMASIIYERYCEKSFEQDIRYYMTSLQALAESCSPRIVKVIGQMFSHRALFSFATLLTMGTSSWNKWENMFYD